MSEMPHGNTLERGELLLSAAEGGRGEVRSGGKQLSREMELLTKKDVAVGDLLQLVDQIMEAQEQRVHACSQSVGAGWISVEWDAEEEAGARVHRAPVADFEKEAPTEVYLSPQNTPLLAPPPPPPPLLTRSAQGPRCDTGDDVMGDDVMGDDVMGDDVMGDDVMGILDVADPSCLHCLHCLTLPLPVTRSLPLELQEKFVLRLLQETEVVEEPIAIDAEEQNQLICSIKRIKGFSILDDSTPSPKRINGEFTRRDSSFTEEDGVEEDTCVWRRASKSEASVHEDTGAYALSPEASTTARALEAIRKALDVSEKFSESVRQAESVKPGYTSLASGMSILIGPFYLYNRSLLPLGFEAASDSGLAQGSRHLTLGLRKVRGISGAATHFPGVASAFWPTQLTSRIGMGKMVLQFQPGKRQR
jgi:hypothetical protein